MFSEISQTIYNKVSRHSKLHKNPNGKECNSGEEKEICHQLDVDSELFNMINQN
jgi:hypothetical protein